MVPRARTGGRRLRRHLAADSWAGTARAGGRLLRKGDAPPRRRAGRQCQSWKDPQLLTGVNLIPRYPLWRSTYGSGCGRARAADHLGISRPTLVKLLEQGDIPFTKVGRHRRVLLTDLIAYEERLEKTRREGLRQATHEAANHGTYFDIPADPATR
ncbi:helix-turn-helix domain-containing protein [Streptomyces sp. tea 10]|nr:helix-turn-helix domain-containing protein [Streptomyces sp. tea 10]